MNTDLFMLMERFFFIWYEYWCLLYDKTNTGLEPVVQVFSMGDAAFYIPCIRGIVNQKVLSCLRMRALVYSGYLTE